MHKHRTSDEVSFGQLVGSYRTLRTKLSQNALAGLIGISEVTLRNWETDQSKPEAKNLQKLLEVFLVRGIFTARKEQEEARAFWDASKVNVVFDEVWTNALANARKPKPEKQGQVDVALTQPLKRAGSARVDRVDHQIRPSDQTPQDLSSMPSETDQDISQLDPASLPAQASASSSSGLWFPKAPTLRDFIASDITRCLLQIAHTDYSTSDEMTTTIQAAIKEFNRMKKDHPTHEITRRDALCELASVPWIALGQKQTLHSKRYGEMLKYCTAALEACWQLYRGSDPVGTRHAFDCVCTYVPILETIAKDSAQYRKEALDLATQYALLQTLLGRVCACPQETVGYARNALSFMLKACNFASVQSDLAVQCVTQLGLAETYAYLKEKDACLEALNRAAKLDASGTGDWYFIHLFDSASLNGYRGACLQQLYDPDNAGSHSLLAEARQALEVALSQPNTGVLRRAFCMADMAQVYACEGKVESACDYVKQVMSMAGTNASLRQSLLVVRVHLKPYAGVEAVKDLDREIRASLLVEQQ